MLGRGDGDVVELRHLKDVFVTGHRFGPAADPPDPVLEELRPPLVDVADGHDLHVLLVPHPQECPEVRLGDAAAADDRGVEPRVGAQDPPVAFRGYAFDGHEGQAGRR